MDRKSFAGAALKLLTRLVTIALQIILLVVSSTPAESLAVFNKFGDLIVLP
jgi:hypothetical protein